MFIKGNLNQLINLYEVANSVVQDWKIFAKWKVLRPFIKKLSDLYNDLKIAQNILRIHCYVFNYRINDVLHIPLMKTESFQYSPIRLYAIPFIIQSQFRLMIEKNRSILKMICTTNVNKTRNSTRKLYLWEIHCTNPKFSTSPGSPIVVKLASN